MSDIVQKLRQEMRNFRTSAERQIELDAADEIESLRSRLADWHKVADDRSAEIVRLNARLAEAEALMRLAVRAVQSRIRKHRRAWQAALKRGDDAHARLHCGRMNDDLALEGRIDAFLTPAALTLKNGESVTRTVTYREGGEVAVTGWVRTGGNAPSGVELRDDGTLYVPPDTPPGTYTVEYEEGTYTDRESAI